MNRWTSRKIQISKKYSEEERQAIAFEIISYIQDRTKAGKGKDNKKWSPPADKYTEGYRSSLDFKNAKGRQRKVNLTLSGDMLDSIDLLDSESGKLTIGIPEGDPDHGKAEGNIRGSYGKPTGSKKKARDFLALSKNEVDKILKNFPLKDEEKREDRVADFLAAAAAAREIFKDREEKGKPTLGAIRFLNGEQ